MGTSRQEIDNWFEHARNLGATHMLVVCDTFDYDDYPVYVGSGKSFEYQTVDEALKHYEKAPMQRTEEVYDISKDKTTQLLKSRVWNA